MGVSCVLEVDVNGEEVFMVDKFDSFYRECLQKILSSYCGRISKLFAKSKGLTRNLKVIFHDFPGGAGSFELMTRFCYNNGKIEINPFSISLLHCIAYYMEMDESVCKTHNLFEQAEKSLEEIRYWTWSELLVALKDCQNLLPIASSSGVLIKCLDSLVGRLALACETSPCPSTSSPDSSGFRLSTDTRSTESLKSFSRATWWFDDLVALRPHLIEMAIKSLVSRKFDNGIISKFLFYYQKSKFVTATSNEKREITETVIELLYSLDQSAVSCKCLFVILRVVLNLHISKCGRNKLESMVGSKLDQASLDNLLVPSPIGTNYLYDVNLILRFIKSFIEGTSSIPLMRLKKVASLMNMYIAEVAPDPSLKPSKFLALVRALPDSARDSYDGIYLAIDMYLEVHAGLSEDEKMKVCCGLNYEKLSSEAWNHLAQNNKFPSKSAAQALISQQCRLKSLLQDTNQPVSPCSFVDTESNGKKDESHDQIVLYAGKLDLSAENEKLKVHLQSMHGRVIELEKVCRKMQTQMSKMMRSRLSSHSNARSLPRLCS
ncbi:hypothetical protein RJ639_011737 [Escallonia herrerae]|uniref:NPH3 domain-containing protein n=1 Tax=Escallonia herrerae TaxID=1293975 RepID=A0AA88VMJ0_9ASTE|nr:hypothetical protein RJ639_011737 [Escallonia herrerae]